jgi:hypothetical protein
MSMGRVETRKCGCCCDDRLVCLLFVVHMLCTIGLSVRYVCVRPQCDMCACASCARVPRCVLCALYVSCTEICPKRA